MTLMHAPILMMKKWLFLIGKKCLKLLLNQSGSRVKEGLMFYEIIKTKLLSGLPLANLTHIS